MAYNVGITIPKLVNFGVKASYTYSNTVTNAQSETLVTRYDKDIKVMDFRLFYCDEDLTYPDPSGVSGNTWYGHIPGIYTNDPNQPVGAQMLYQEFRVENN